MSKYRYIALVLLAVSCLALGGVFVRISEVGPVATGAYRSLFAIPLLMAVSRVTRGRAVTPRVALARSDHVKLVLAGVFLAMDLCLWNVSFTYTTLAESNLLANLVPFIVAPISFFFLKEHVPARILLPGLLALVGLYALAILGSDVKSPHFFGNALALSTAVFYALFLVTTKRLRGRLPAAQIMVYVSVYSCLVLAVIAVVKGERLLPATAWGWIVLVLLALSSQIAGQTLMAHAVKFLPLPLASIFILFQPVIAAVYAYVLFDESLTVVQIVGIAILLVAIYWAKIVLEKKSVASERSEPVRVG